MTLLTGIWKLNHPSLTLLFQCGSNYNRFIDPESPFYQTQNLWLLTDGKQSGKSLDLVLSSRSPRIASKIGILSVNELDQFNLEDGNSIHLPSTLNFDSDCRVFIFVDSGPSPVDQAIRLFRNAIVEFLQKGNDLFKYRDLKVS